MGLASSLLLLGWLVYRVSQACTPVIRKLHARRARTGPSLTRCHARVVLHAKNAQVASSRQQHTNHALTVVQESTVRRAVRAAPHRAVTARRATMSPAPARVLPANVSCVVRASTSHRRGGRAASHASQEGSRLRLAAALLRAGNALRGGSSRQSSNRFASHAPLDT